MATGIGEWTKAVDDKLWDARWNDCVLPAIFSEDGKHLAAIVKSDNRWSIAEDGQAWSQDYDMVWDPVFSPDGETVMTKVENGGRYSINANGREWGTRFDAMWEPAFSPDGKMVLVRGVEDGKFYRQVVPLSEITG